MIVKMLFVFLMILDVVAVLHFAIELGGHEINSGGDQENVPWKKISTHER